MSEVKQSTQLVQEALRLLGVQRLVLAIHDASLPALPEEDTGCGSPYSEGGRRFLSFVRGLGFTGVQFGPQGELSPGNQSPYDASMFSRSVLSVALAPLLTAAWGALLTQEELQEVVSQRPATPANRAHHRYAEGAVRRALSLAHQRLQRQGDTPLAQELARFSQQNEAWLLRGALYTILREQNHSLDFHAWSDPLDQRLFSPAHDEASRCEARQRQLLREHASEVEEYALSQLLMHKQHRALRDFAHAEGLALYGDLQIGQSLSDAWGLQHLYLESYRLGAPPSRTNPLGQPWGYLALAPEKYAEGGLSLMRARLQKLFSEFDGVRIDHPHGLIDPWVYQHPSADALRAVQGGARLFSSPGLPDHPALAAYAIAQERQLNRNSARYADDWVGELSSEQVGAYAAIFEVIMSCAREAGHSPQALICEVLSTMPAPVGAVLQRYGLGRFRVTQKANTRATADVYRAENASPQDWIMVGTHDTAPLWLLLQRWEADDTLKEQASYLAWRLSDNESEQEQLRQALSQDVSLLAHAKFADLFLGPAQNVSIFFSDLFGLTDIYNTPGTISDENWSLRLPHDYQERFLAKQKEGAALDLNLALAMALRGPGANEARRALATKLEQARSEAL